MKIVLILIVALVFSAGNLYSLPNVALNPGFEVAGTNGWYDADVWTGEGTNIDGTVEMVVRTNEAYNSGNWALKIKDGKWKNILQYIPLDVGVEKHVTAKCMVMTPSSDPAAPSSEPWATGAAILKIEHDDSNEKYAEVWGVDGSSLDTWMPIETSAIIPIGETNLKVVCMMYSDGTLFFDDVEFIVSNIYLFGESNLLTTTASPKIGGSIQLTPDRSLFASGEVVTAVANANPDFEFVNWSGDASGFANSIILTMDAPRAVQANFIQKTIPVPNSNIWETFDSPKWYDNTWYGQEPNSENIQFSYTNYDGRSCLAYHIVDSGSNAQLHTDFGLYPNYWDFLGSLSIAMDIWVPNLGQPYSLRLIAKSHADDDIAISNFVVNSEGWITITADIFDLVNGASVYWLAIGGFTGDPNLPAGKTTTFFIDKVYATGTGGNVLIDDFNVNPTWTGDGNWTKRPRDWRYDTDSDYLEEEDFDSQNYHSIGIDPTGTKTGLVMVLPFFANQSAETFAKVENDGKLYSDMSLAGVIEADVRVTASNVPVRFSFSDISNTTEFTAYQTVQPGDWQHLSWNMPPKAGSFNWGNVEKLGVIVRTEPGDADDAILYLDNISFIIPEPGMILAGIALVLMAFRKK